MSKQVSLLEPKPNVNGVSAIDRNWKLQPQSTSINRKQMVITLRRRHEYPFVPLAEAIPETTEHLKRFQESDVVKSIPNIRNTIDRLDRELAGARETLKNLEVEYRVAAKSGDTMLTKEQSANVNWANQEINDREAERSRLLALLKETYAAAESEYRQAQEVMNEDLFGANHRKVGEVQDRIEAVLNDLLDELVRAFDSRTRSVRLSFPPLEKIAGPKPSEASRSFFGKEVVV